VSEGAAPPAKRSKKHSDSSNTTTTEVGDEPDSGVAAATSLLRSLCGSHYGSTTVNSMRFHPKQQRYVAKV
jgi:hypothetical protein